MAHIGDKYSHLQLKAKKLEDKEELNKEWTLHPSYIKAQYLADEALKRNAWLFDPEGKRWYTPEEFIAETKSLPTGAKIFEVVQIRYPIDGINAAYKQIAILYEKVHAFTQRVFDYYHKK